MTAISLLISSFSIPSRSSPLRIGSREGKVTIRVIDLIQCFRQHIIYTKLPKFLIFITQLH